jgi:peptidyl-prolyl cis-trans isomerase SurA
MTEIRSISRGGLATALVMACLAALPAQAQPRARNGDYIVAVVNQEAVTAGEVDQRLVRAREGGSREGGEAELRNRIVEALIEERVIVTYARESGIRIDEPELDRAVQNVAVQNQLTGQELRRRLREEGIDYARFRANLRDQMLIERVREREVYPRIRITDAEIDQFLERQLREAAADIELNIAQILVTVPEGADDATVGARLARAQAALARVRAGEAFDAVAREMSEDGNRARGGEIGPRPASRLPDLFVDAVKPLAPGGVIGAPIRSGAGFHVLKLIERRDAAALRVTQTRARHILLRTSPQLTPEVAGRRLAEYRRQIESNSAKFEDLARAHSEDGSAAQGGDLGWVAPGVFVREFEEAMNKLAVGGISPPVITRFGVHLIQVLERRDVALEVKQLREQARGSLREQKFEQAYADWAKELRARAYVEMREPPL